MPSLNTEQFNPVTLSMPVQHKTLARRAWPAKAQNRAKRSLMKSSESYINQIRLTPSETRVVQGRGKWTWISRSITGWATTIW